MRTGSFAEMQSCFFGKYRNFFKTTVFLTEQAFLLLHKRMRDLFQANKTRSRKKEKVPHAVVEKRKVPHAVGKSTACWTFP